MNTINIKLYNTLRQSVSLDEKKARELTQAMEEAIKDELNSDHKGVATKDFVKKEIAESKNDIIKWMVGVFFALALMIIGLYLK